VEKLQRVLQLCDECGVVRQPVLLGGLMLVPLLSWHHKVCRHGVHLQMHASNSTAPYNKQYARTDKTTSGSVAGG
jgi:hypothetical protein